MAPVLAANTAIAIALTTLSPGGGSQAARSALTTAQNATQTAQRAVAALSPSKSETILAAQVSAALTSELAWLETASAVVIDPSSPLLSQLSALGLDAQTKLQALGGNQPPTASTVFSSSTQILTYASATAAKAQAAAASAAAAAQAAAADAAAKAQAAAADAAAKAQATASNVQFSGQVQALLNQSTSSLDAVRSFYQQLQAVANGGYATFTLAQAEQQITSIVANRTSLAAAAQALNAPTAAAQAVSADLVAAFSASLKDDTDLNNCLNQNNNGIEAYIFQGCLSASAADSNAATTAKQTFLGIYNQLRASIGQPAFTTRF